MLDGSHFYWKKAFPLYGRDYDSVVEAIEKMERSLPGFFYAGMPFPTLVLGSTFVSEINDAGEVGDLKNRLEIIHLLK